MAMASRFETLLRATVIAACALVFSAFAHAQTAERSCGDCTPAEAAIWADLQEAQAALDNAPGEILSELGPLLDAARGEGSPRLEAEALKLQGRAYFFLNEMSAALDAAIASAMRFEDAGDGRGRVEAANLIAVIYGQTGQLDKARETLLNALDVARARDYPLLEGRILRNIGVSFALDDRPDEALRYAREALDVLSAVGDTSESLFARLNIAQTIVLHGDTAAALPILEELRDEAVALDDKRVAVEALSGIGVAHTNMGAFEMAEETLKQALAIAEETDLIVNQVTVLTALAENAERSGDFAAALDRQKRVVALNERMFSEENARELAALRDRFDAMENEARLAEGELALIRSQRRALWAALAAFVFFAIALAAFVQYRNKQITNRRLRILAEKDELTGLLNRRAMTRTIEEAMASRERDAAAAPATRCVAAMIDVDDFKLINDRYGHQAGDDVLRSLAQTLRKTLRPDDRVARWGGEEFLAVMPGVPAGRVPDILERVRGAIEAEVRVESDDGPRPVTVTIGAAANEEGLSAEDWIKRADAALYAGKRGGRNQWRLYEPTMDGPAMARATSLPGHGAVPSPG